MEAFLISTGIVALAEIGDKTQLLSLVLAARYPRQATAIILGILVATIANHAGAGALGAWIMSAIGPDILRWVLGVSFIAMAGWMLIPDKLDEDEIKLVAADTGVFFSTVAVFFLAEMGDKTQIATIALAAQYAGSVVWVIAGTTLGMMLANVPAVLLGSKAAHKIPLKLVHSIAAVIFAVLGVLVLAGIKW